MQHTQNNLTVENLVNRYRNYVSNYIKVHGIGMVVPVQDDEGKWDEIIAPCSPDENADEQLLIALYKTVAGESVDNRIIDALWEYAEKYQKACFSEDEFAFLCENFSEVVFYEFAHRDKWLNGEHAKHITDGISKERIRLVKEYVKPQKGARVFIADTEYCDLAVLFPDCIISGFTGMNYEQKIIWALGEIRLFAAGIQSEIVSGEEVNDEYSYTLPAKGTVDAVIFRVNENKYAAQKVYGTECKDIEALYELLKPGGKMLFFSESMEEMAGHDADYAFQSEAILSFRTRVVYEKNVSAIIEYEDKETFFGGTNSYLLLIVEKKYNKEVLIKDEVAKRTFSIKEDSLCEDILWPSFYYTVRPQNGVPLSELVTFKKLKDREIKKENDEWILSEEMKKMPVVITAKMAKEYKDANLLTRDLDLAGSSAFSSPRDYYLMRPIKEKCVLLSGKDNQFVVGYINALPESGVATFANIVCLVPNHGIDVRYIAALLLSHEVKDQIVSICKGNVGVFTLPLILNKVIVPNHSDKERLAFLSEANYEALQTSQMDMKQEHKNYTKAIRMRKHALTQSLSAIESMFYALNAYRVLQNGQISDDGIISRVKGTSVREAFDFISKNLEDMMPALEHIAAVDYSFDKPEWIDPELFIEDYIKRNENGWLNFKPIMMWEKGHNQAPEDILEPFSGEIVLSKGNSIYQFLFPKDALERVFKNIISNAQAHGFDKKTRDDYQLRFSWHMEGLALIVEIDNNGSPIPNDRDTASLLEYGVSTALHQDGHNGIGCNEIDDIMQRYDGNVEIVSSPENEFPVKYILKFNRSNIIGSI